MKNRFVTKIVTVALILSVVIVIFPLAVSAESSNLTKEEAKALFSKAFDSYYLSTRGEYKPLDENGNNDIGHGEFIIKIKEGTSAEYLTATNGKPYRDSPQRFNQVSFSYLGRDISKYTEMISYIDEAYTEEMRNKIITTWDLRDVGVFDLIRPGANDELLYSHSVSDANRRPINKCMGYTGEFSVNGNTATLGIYVGVPDKYIFEGIHGYTHKKIATTVEFENTVNGWRVSGGDFFEVFESLAKVDNPSTGSPTPIYLALAGAAVLCALPVVKRKRRI